MNEEITIKPQVISPLKKICMTIGELPTSYLETMTYYEMLVWFTHFLRDNIIPVINNNGEAVTELQNLFVELQNYVNNYFDNLDVQEEINNKLDQMAESGQLTDIIAQYLGLAGMIAFDTVASMKLAENLVNGSKCTTLGYYSVNDGGGATYKVRTVTNEDVIDEASIIALADNTLIAELIIENDTINLKQLGGKSSDIENNEKFDNKNYILKYEAICNKDGKTYKLIIDNGYWLFSPTHFTRFSGLNIEGDSSFPREPFMGSTILPYNSTQTYIWKFGGNEDYTNTTNLSLNSFITQTSLNNLHFTTNSNGYLNEAYEDYEITVGLLVLDCCMYWDMNNIYIQRFKGNGLRVRNAWEFNIGNLMFRTQNGFSYSNIYFDKAVSMPNISGNISSFDINNLMFEGTEGSLIYSAKGSGFSHNHIGHINIENVFSNDRHTITGETVIANLTPIDLITGMYRSLIIDSINFFYNIDEYSSDGTNNYYFRSLFRVFEPASNSSNDVYETRFHVNVGELTCRHTGHTSLVYSHDCYKFNQLNIGSLLFMDGTPLIPFDFESGIQLNIGTINKNDNLITERDINDSINYFSVGRGSSNWDTNCLKYDSTAPTFCKLVTNMGGNIGGIYFTNTKGTTFKIKVLYKSPATPVNMIIKDLVTNSWQTITAGATTGYEWVEHSFTGTTALGNKLSLISNTNDVAKIIVEEAS